MVRKSNNFIALFIFAFSLLGYMPHIFEAVAEDVAKAGVQPDVAGASKPEKKVIQAPSGRETPNQPGAEMKNIQASTEAPSDISPTDFINDLPDITFEFAMFHMEKSQKKILKKVATVIKNHGGVPVVIEAYCDNRGKYNRNVALAKKRVGMVKKYLVANGVKKSQLSTMVYVNKKPPKKANAKKGLPYDRMIRFAPPAKK